MSTCRFLVVNGVFQGSDVPSISELLENHQGAYTTTRTHLDNSCLMFWDRHLKRLAESVKILAESRPAVFGSKKNLNLSSSTIRSLVENSLPRGLSKALKEIDKNEEIAITALISGTKSSVIERQKDRDFDLFVHLSAYVPPNFSSRDNGACLALVGLGRELPMAKYSDWVRKRKSLEILRPPLTSELLLSKDGDQILEGTVTNFFVVCHQEVDSNQIKGIDGSHPVHNYVIQTSPVSDGVLPGVLRQLIIEICLAQGLPLQEVSPSWSNRAHWREAFVTNSLRLVQHVERIQAPSSRESLYSKTWQDISWVKKEFEGPGMITMEIQREVVKRIGTEGYPLNNLL